MNGLDSILHRLQPTLWVRFWASPLRFLAQRIYQATVRKGPVVSQRQPIRVVCISDTHNAHASLPTLPDGDILIHAGDLTQSGTLPELHAVLQWLNSQPHPHKIYVGGNHDEGLEDDYIKSVLRDTYTELHYLEDSTVTLAINGRTLQIYGSPKTPRNGSGAFRYRRIAPSNARSATTWDGIRFADILVTHGPPAYHLDCNYGCPSLLRRLWTVRPKLHVFGHIHAARGVQKMSYTRAQMAYERIMMGEGGWLDLFVMFAAFLDEKPDSTRKETTLVNAASVAGFRDELIRPAIVVEI